MAKKKKPPAKLGAIGRAELADLRNIQRNQYYVPGKQKYLKHLAMLVQTGKKAPGSQDWKVRAGKATKSPLALRAGRTVQAELNPMISAAKNYETGLQTMYGQLGQQNQQTIQQMANQQNAATADLNKNYDSLASGIASQFRQGRESTSDELARLGLTGIPATDSVAQEQMFANLAQSGRANALSQQQAGSTAFNNLMQLLSTDAQNTGAELRAASSQKRGQLEASRPGKVAALFGSLQDQAKAQRAEAAQQAFLNRITQSKLATDSDYKNAQALGALANARKNIVDSRRPSKKRVKVIR